MRPEHSDALGKGKQRLKVVEYKLLKLIFVVETEAAATKYIKLM
jgi:hypothetical protein